MRGDPGVGPAEPAPTPGTFTTEGATADASAVASPAYPTGGTEPWITAPGLYPGISDVAYHADPVVGGSVSSTVLRLMTPPKGTPAHGRHYLADGRQDQSYYDLGSAYHTGVLGVGAPVVEVAAASWQGSAARALQATARAQGGIPLLSKECRLVEAMVAATLADPDCAQVFAPGSFTAELVLVWRDPDTGVMCRAKIDAIPDYTTRLRVVDLKTKQGHADPGSVASTVERHAYHQQFAFYIAGIEAMVALGLLAPVEDIEPVLVVCGKDAPHVPLARPLDADSLAIGRVQNRKALDLYATCRARDEWPGYNAPDGKRDPIGLPYWAKRRFEFDYDTGLYDIEELDQ